MDGSSEFAFHFSPYELMSGNRDLSASQVLAGEKYHVKLRVDRDSFFIYVSISEKLLETGLFYGYYSLSYTLKSAHRSVSFQQKPVLSSFSPQVLHHEIKQWQSFDYTSTMSLHVKVNVEDFHLFKLDRPQVNFGYTQLGVNGKKIYVCSSILSTQSPFFAQLFFSKAVPQIDVDQKAFLLLLYFMYGIEVSFEKSKDLKLVKGLLVLVDRFQCRTVRLAIERSLMQCNTAVLQKSLKEIDQCGMKRLIVKVVDSLRKEDLKKFQDGSGFAKKYSKSTIDLIFARVISFLEV